MQYGKPLLTLLLAASLAACTTTPSPQVVQRQTQAPPVPKYVSAESVPPLNVPVVTGDNTAQNNYTVAPAETNAAAPSAASLAPPGSNLEQASNPQPVVATAANPATAQPAAVGNAAQNPAPAASTSSSGRVALAVNMNYGQTWSQLKKVLPTAGYPVMEEDNFSGTYYILDKVSSNGSIKRDTPIYQLHLEKRGDKTTVVTVLNNQNQPADSAVATRILTAVKKSI